MLKCAHARKFTKSSIPKYFCSYIFIPPIRVSLRQEPTSSISLNPAPTRSAGLLLEVEKLDKYELIRLTTDLLLSLYAEGWEPMTPIDTAVDKADKQTSICWKKREEVGGPSNFRGSAISLASVTTKGRTGSCCFPNFQNLKIPEYESNIIGHFVIGL